MEFLRLNIGRAVAPAKVLCYTCLFGHIQRGFTMGEEMIQCTFGYGMRFLPFYVVECTDYDARPNIKPGISFRSAPLVQIKFNN